MYARPSSKPVPPPSMQTAPVPAAVGGLNTITPGSQMPPTDAFVLYNMVAAEYGLRTRLGSREWCSGLLGAGDNYVRSVLPFTGSAANGAQNKIFATTSMGIWDVKDSGFVTGDAYAASTAYEAGEAVVLASEDYLCTEEGTTDAGGAAPAWAAATAYNIWSLVTSDSKIYCQTGYLTITSGSGAMAPTGAGDFTDTESGFVWAYVGAAGAIPNNKSLPVVWLPLTAYKIGQRVIFDSQVFYCLTAGSSGAAEPSASGTDNVIDSGVIWSPVTVDGVISSDAIPDGTAVFKYFSSNIPPTLEVSFGITSGRAGHGVCHVHVTSAGHFLLYADEANGLHVYTEGGAWAAVALGGGGTQISGVDPTSFAFVTVFKGRVWAIPKDTADLWYSAAGSIYGAYTKFALGTKLKAGGPLIGAWSWTYDGGDGLDDRLVCVSKGGDVPIYAGTDPASATTWGLVGSWNVGDMPEGRELATDFGGELLLLTRMGILPMSKLISGQAQDPTQFATGKVSQLFNAAMLSKATTAGWSLRLHPEENALMVTVPEADGVATTQLLMALPTKGWSRNRDLPVYSNAVFGGKMYFGTVDGSVCINDGYVDGRPLYDPTEYTPVQYSGVGAFFDLGNARQKQCQLIRAYFMGQSTRPSWEVAARYDFDITELDPVTPSAGSGSLWDSALWDSGVWGGEYSPSMEVRGATGMGVNVAIAWRGAAVDRTVLVKFEVGYTMGGYL